MSLITDNPERVPPQPKQMGVPLPPRFKLEQGEEGLKISGPTRPRPLGAAFLFLALTGLALFLFLRTLWSGSYFEAFVLMGIPSMAANPASRARIL